MSKATVVSAAQAAVVAAIEATTAARLTLDEALKLPDDVPAPTITNARVEPATLPYGGGVVTVSADVANADTVTLNGVPVVLPAVMTVTADALWVLTATGPGGSASADLSVDVADAPPAPTFELDVKPVNLSRCLVAPGYYHGDRYDRFQIPVIVKGDRATLTVSTRDIAAGGTRPAFGFAAPLSLLFDGRPVAVATTVATANSVAFDVPLAALKGWYRTSVAGAPAGWSVLDYAVFVDDGSGEVPTHMPVVIASYGLTHPYKASSTETPQPIHVSAMVPAVYSPTLQPLPPRECLSFTTDPRRDQLVQTQLAICRQDDKYRPVKSGGVLNTANRQDYFWSDVTEKRPWFHMLDGPRGRGTVVCPTHIEVGKFTFPDGTNPNGPRNIYLTEPQRIVRVAPDGNVKTLVGYRHREPHWNDPAQDVELVGDWSAIPEAERGFRELWGLAWDSRSTVTDTAAAPIPEEGNLKPHIRGVTSFVTDMLNNRVCKIEADPRSHVTPRKVSVFWRGAEPWDCCEVAPGVLAVSVRKENRIVGLSMDDASVLWSFPAPAPEGVYFLDGWLYYGSKTAKSVRKRNLATGEDVLFRDMAAFVDNNSMYIKLAVSDGTFGPRGMVGMVTWSNNGYGYPHFFRPNGSEVAGWLWAGTLRPGRAWVGSGDPAPGYATAIAFGFGRAVCGGVQEGLMQLSKALPTDLPLLPAYFAGQRQWYEKGYQLTHGHRGFGFYGLPLPWNVTPDIDAFLIQNGHTQ